MVWILQEIAVFFLIWVNFSRKKYQPSHLWLFLLYPGMLCILNLVTHRKYLYNVHAAFWVGLVKFCWVCPHVQIPTSYLDK